MANEKETPVIPESAVPAKPRTQVIKVRLDQLELKYDDYSHRDEEALKPAALQPLLNSIRSEGLRHKLEVYRQDDGKYVVVTGHRRFLCLQQLGKDGVTGFAIDMEIEVVELLDTTSLDRLAWSVADNETRVNLTATERIGVAKKFLKAGMPDERGADALGLSVKQYRRDLALVRNEWMLELVEKNAIPATVAVELLEAAEKHNRLMELKTFLVDWVAEVELEIEAEGEKRELKPAEKLVKSRLTKALRRHWLERLASKKELDADAQQKIKVDLNPKTLEVAVEGFKLNLATDSVEDIGRVLGALSQVIKNATPILKTRTALEAPEGPQAALLGAKDASGLDEEFLKEAGLEELISPPRQSPFERPTDAPKPPSDGTAD